MKSLNLNFLEPFGPLQACNGTDFYIGDWPGFLESSVLVSDEVPDGLCKPDDIQDGLCKMWEEK
jgi:hypothetical protein